MNTEEKLMDQLISYAYEKMDKNHAYPFCAFVVNNGIVVSKGFNSRVIDYGDITTHGEMEAFSKAAKSLKLKDLIFGKSYTLYTTCEPCLACFDTALWHRIGKIVYSVDHTGFPEYFHDHPYTIDNFIEENPNFIQIEKNVLKDKGIKLFKKAKEVYGW
jgi:tRNA(Arg) A34 adenosine deaminase TadA